MVGQAASFRDEVPSARHGAQLDPPFPMGESLCRLRGSPARAAGLRRSAPCLGRSCRRNNFGEFAGGLGRDASPGDRFHCWSSTVNDYCLQSVCISPKVNRRSVQIVHGTSIREPSMSANLVKPKKWSKPKVRRLGSIKDVAANQGAGPQGGGAKT